MISSQSVANVSARSPIRWLEMRCARCHHLLQKIEVEALRPGKRLEIKCVHCKMFNYLVGESRPAVARPASPMERSRTVAR